MARYYPVSPKFWTDPKVRDWDDSTKALALYLLTCEHRNLEGLYRLPRSYAQADLRWSQGKLDRCWSRLEADGFIAYDPDSEVVLLPAALKYQSPQTEKQIRGAINVLEAVPPSKVYSTFVEACETHAPKLHKALLNGSAK